MLGGDGDVDSLSADEKSDSEGKNDRMSTSSSSTSITSSTDTQEVRSTRIINTYMRIRPGYRRTFCEISVSPTRDVMIKILVKSVNQPKNEQKTLN